MDLVAISSTALKDLELVAAHVPNNQVQFEPVVEDEYLETFQYLSVPIAIHSHH